MFSSRLLRLAFLRNAGIVTLAQKATLVASTTLVKVLPLLFLLPLVVSVH